MSSEKPEQSKTVIRAFELGFSLWRNNNGVLTDKNGTPVRFGLGNDSKKINKVWKSPDYVGIGPGGRFMGIEFKPKTWVRPMNEHEEAQKACLDDINRRGGIGLFITSVEEFENWMERLTP